MKIVFSDMFLRFIWYIFKFENLNFIKIRNLSKWNIWIKQVEKFLSIFDLCLIKNSWMPEAPKYLNAKL